MDNLNYLIYFCEQFYSSHYLPIAIFYNNKSNIHSFCPIKNWGDFIRQNINLNSPFYPYIYNSQKYGIFGLIKVCDYYLVIGPARAQKKSDNSIKIIAHELNLSNEEFIQLKEFFYALPNYTYNHFFNLLSFLEFSLNKNKIDIKNYYLLNQNFSKFVEYNKVNNHIKDNNNYHGTYYFEKIMLEYIKNGDSIKLNDFFNKVIKKQKFNEGKVGNNELRQAKNILLAMIALVGKTSAIDGGMDIEESYNLIDLYSIECERCINIKQVKDLQLNALLDFTSRIGDSKKILKYSNDVKNAIYYIKNNLYKIKEIMEIVSYVNVSKTKLSNDFKKQVGKTLNEYLNDEKLNEAKLLLKYSDESIVNISLFLNYSSQSYFNNKFKNKFNITPNDFRKKYK